jgi:hypothetical protein
VSLLLLLAGGLPARLRAQVPGAKNIVINEVARLDTGDHAVELYNYGPSQLMTNWRLTYNTNWGQFAYTLPAFTLGRHGLVTVHWGAGANSATDLYTGTFIGTGLDGELLLQQSNGKGIDYLAWGNSANSLLLNSLAWDDNIPLSSSTCPLARMRDVNTRTGHDWVNDCASLSPGSLNPMQIGTRRHSGLMINEFFVGSSSQSPWVEVYNPNNFYLEAGRASLSGYTTSSWACDGYTFPWDTVFAPAGRAVVYLPGCFWSDGGYTGVGQIRLDDPAWDGLDYVSFNTPSYHYLSPDTAWNGGDIAVTGSMVMLRKGNLDADNFRDWRGAASGGEITPGWINPGQQTVIYDYDELGDESQLLARAAAGGWGNIINVTTSFTLREFKVRAVLPGTRDLVLAIKKGGQVVYYQTLATQSSAGGSYSTGPINFRVDAGAQYAFMLYASGPFSLYASANNEKFRYGTILGTDGENAYPPANGTPFAGLDATTAFMQYFYTQGGPQVFPIILPGTRATDPYSQTFSSPSGSDPLAWQLVGAGVPGLSFNAATQLLSGNPTTPGTYNFSVQATDASGITSSRGYSIVVSPAGVNGTLLRSDALATLSPTAAEKAAIFPRAPANPALPASPVEQTNFAPAGTFAHQASDYNNFAPVIFYQLDNSSGALRVSKDTANGRIVITY